MIAQFPEFDNITIAHQKDIERYTSQFEPYSDFEFASLFCWDVDNTTGISWLNGNLVIRLPDYLTGEPVYSLLGKTKVDESLAMLLKETPELKLVPEFTIQDIKQPSQFTITEDPDNFDYIYSNKELSELTGGKFKGKRKNISRFLNDYDGQWKLNIINFQDLATPSQIMSIFDMWGKQRPRKEEEIIFESRALNRLLGSAGQFKLAGLEIMIGDEPVGFSINELTNDRYAVCHFQKSLLKYNGIDVFLSSQNAQLLQELNIDFTNWEQDLGIPGLKELKEGYKPIKMLKKYRVTLS